MTDKEAGPLITSPLETIGIGARRGVDGTINLISNAHATGNPTGMPGPAMSGINIPRGRNLKTARDPIKTGGGALQMILDSVAISPVSGVNEARDGIPGETANAQVKTDEIDTLVITDTSRIKDGMTGATGNFHLTGVTGDFRPTAAG